MTKHYELMLFMTLCFKLLLTLTTHYSSELRVQYFKVK